MAQARTAWTGFLLAQWDQARQLASAALVACHTRPLPALAALGAALDAFHRAGRRMLAFSVIGTSIRVNTE